MERAKVEAVRRNYDDLRDELKELEKWEDDMARLHESKKNNNKSFASTATEPPIRGTVPSIKQALIETARQQGKKLSAEEDAVQKEKEKGNEYFRCGKFSEAIESYTAGIDLDPTGDNAYILYGNRAMCFLKHKEWEKAEKDATLCIQMNRGYVKGYFRRAIARKNLNNLAGARGDLEAVLALAPKDSNALEELTLVTRMQQAAREAVAPTPSRKRIVIQEVEDEDEDEAAVASETAFVEKESSEDRMKIEMAHIENVRQKNEHAKRVEVHNATKAMEARRKHNTRVEVIEDESGGGNEGENLAETERLPTQHQTILRAEPQRHVDLAPTQALASDGRESATAGVPSVRLAPAIRSRSKPLKESLRSPDSFTEFERIFSDIEADDELRNHYVNSINPASLSSLFGSNITPEILIGLLRSIKQFSSTVALQYLKGLCKIRRVEDVVLFFNMEEKQLVNDVLDLIKAGGATEKDVASIALKLKPF